MNGLNTKNMLIKCYNEDDGTAFGTWEDTMSKMLYFDSTLEILRKIDIPNQVADYGGGNGLLKKFIPHAKTIDCDVSKKPDIIDNILTHDGEYNLVVLRYVLHYLDDYQVLKLFKNIKAKNILVIQFTNQDLKSKYHNSVNEYKYFRNVTQLKALLPKQAKEIYCKKYKLDETFYFNRLGHGNYVQHQEHLRAFYI
tara:strand:- start:16565 stop:17152 length:588 start_codon:yes stop_codon:yes gene_type:complete